MTEQTKVTTLEQVVIRFSGDSGDGMQLTGTIFSNLSAIFGNEISTFPDYPAEVRAPQGTLSGVSGFQVHLGSKKIFTPGDKADVLVAMNPAALKVNVKNLKPNAIVLIDTDSFKKSDLEKALYTTDDPFQELGLTQVQVVAARRPERRQEFHTRRKRPDYAGRHAQFQDAPEVHFKGLRSARA